MLIMCLPLIRLHQTLDDERYLYPLPYEYYEDFRVRKYGFHGLSHLYVSQKIIEYLGHPKHSRIIVCHLGNGGSVSAIEDGSVLIHQWDLHL